jgi:tol-pal system protein YbgF
MRVHRVGILVLALIDTACFATRNDVRILQGDVLAFRAEAARADSARARQLTTIVDRLNVALTALSDSVRDVSARLGRFQGDTRQELRSVEQQLIYIQELTGQSQSRLQELRAEMEARSQQPTVIAPAAAPGDTTRNAAAAAPSVPGPNQLMVIAATQRQQNSYSTAREAYQQVLDNYPNSDRAAEAQYWIAETLNAERKTASADSAYQIVITKHPRDPYAARSIFRLGQSLDRQKKCAEAKAMMERVVREFPQSDDATRAKEFTCSSR